MINASAKSKIILTGEHAVIYGAKAIAIPFNAYSSVTIQQQKNKGIFFITREKNDKKSQQWLKKICKHILDELEEKNPNLKIEIKYDFPPGLGLGLSASISIALCKGLYEFFGKKISKENLLKLVSELEKLSHGKSSGIDHSVIIYDQAILFQKSKNSIKIRKLPHLLNEEIFKHCYLINSGKPKESTKQMVEFVAKKTKKSPDETKKLFKEIDKISTKILEDCTKNNYLELLNSINKSGILLEDLGIVSKKVKALCQELRSIGAAVKVSGAGGKSDKGSGILIVFHKDKKLLQKKIAKYKYTLQDLKVDFN